MNNVRRNRFSVWLLALAVLATTAACAGEYEGDYDEEFDSVVSTDEERQALQSLDSADAAALWGSGDDDADYEELGAGGEAKQCKYSDQCGPGKYCVAGACVGGKSCTSSSECKSGESCRANYCQKTDASPNNPCDVSAGRAFGSMVCKAMCSWDTNLWTECLQAVYAAHSCWGARNTPEFPDCTRPEAEPEPEPEPEPGPACTGRGGMCSSGWDCCSGLSCSGGGFSVKTCR